MDPAGFEPAASSLQRRDSPRLSYAARECGSRVTGETTTTADVPGETRTLSLARAKGTFFLLELRARSFARWLSRSAVLTTCPWSRDDDMEPATAKSRVGFEPTIGDSASHCVGPLCHRPILRSAGAAPAVTATVGTRSRTEAGAVFSHVLSH
jgi:hypothetical protein